MKYNPNNVKKGDSVTFSFDGIQYDGVVVGVNERGNNAGVKRSGYKKTSSIPTAKLTVKV